MIKQIDEGRKGIHNSKVGDVLHIGHEGTRQKHLAIVKSKTPTGQVKTNRGDVFNKNGMARSSPYKQTGKKMFAQIAKGKDKDKDYREKSIGMISNNIKDVPTEKLKAIHKLLGYQAYHHGTKQWEETMIFEGWTPMKKNGNHTGEYVTDRAEIDHHVDSGGTVRCPNKNCGEHLIGPKTNLAMDPQKDREGEVTHWIGSCHGCGTKLHVINDHEEIEGVFIEGEINEISKETLKSYQKKARKDNKNLWSRLDYFYRKPKDERNTQWKPTIKYLEKEKEKREIGIRKVRYKLKHEETVTEATKHLDTYEPKRPDGEFKGDRYELHAHGHGEKHEWHSIIKTHQGGKHLKNQWGGYSSVNLGSPKHVAGRWKNLKAHYDNPNIRSGGSLLKKEEIELTEISKQRLGDYIERAATDVGRFWSKNYAGPLNKKIHRDKTHRNADNKKLLNRRYGIIKAVDKLKKEEQDMTTWNRIKEILSETRQLKEILGEPRNLRVAAKNAPSVWAEAQHSKGGGAKRVGLDSESDDHIVNQLRKAQNIDNFKVAFKDKKKHPVSGEHATKALKMYDAHKTADEKLSFAARLHHSHGSFTDALAGKPAPKVAPKKISLGGSALVGGIGKKV